MLTDLWDPLYMTGFKNNRVLTLEKFKYSFLHTFKSKSMHFLENIQDLRNYLERLSMTALLIRIANPC